MQNSTRRRGAIAVIAQGDCFLVILRSALVRAPNQYCFPGGGIEAGESEAQAVVREVREEIGVLADPIERIWQSTARSGIELNWWKCELQAGPLKIDCREVASVHWMTLRNLLEQDRLLPSNRVFLQRILSGEIIR